MTISPGWAWRTQSISSGVTRLAIERDGRSMRWRGVAKSWIDEPAFARFFADGLSARAALAVRWEAPPLTAGRLDDPFECVLLADRHLDRPPDSSAFRAHFGAGPVATFDNLGGDSRLIAPRPHGDANYCHLAVFLRAAPMASIEALWAAVGRALLDAVGPAPIWLSTAGGGVPWLHVRLDARPKYYRFAPYRHPNARSTAVTPAH